MQERAFANEKIRFVWDSEVIDIVGDDKVEAVRLRNVETGEETTLEVTGLFVAIGHDPRSELFDGQIRRDDEGYILVDAPSTRTNLTGVFACGDVVDHIYRQAVTAAGTGCAAALDAERYLTSLGGRRAAPATRPRPSSPSTSSPDTRPAAQRQSDKPKGPHRGRHHHHQGRHRRQLRRRRAAEREGRARRLLGGVVRPVPSGVARSSRRSPASTPTRSRSSSSTSTRTRARPPTTASRRSRR